MKSSVLCCGSIPGYEELVAAMADPRHPERERLIEWLGEPYNPAAFDLNAVATLLQLRKL